MNHYVPKFHYSKGRPQFYPIVAFTVALVTTMIGAPLVSLIYYGVFR